jgi:putative FmdB family regulatory protein
MPIFEYYCSKCKELFEELVSNPGLEKVPCPKCGQREHVKKCMSAASIGRGSLNAQSSPSAASCSPGPFS